MDAPLHNSMHNWLVSHDWKHLEANASLHCVKLRCVLMGLIGDKGNDGDISGFVLEARTRVMINMTHVPIMNLLRQWLSPGGLVMSHN